MALIPNEHQGDDSEEGSIGLNYCGGLKEGGDQGAAMGTDLLVQTGGVSVISTEYCTLAKAPGDSLLQRLPLHVQKAIFPKALRHRARARLTMLPSLKKKNPTKTMLPIVRSSDTP